jgi:uridine kinase
VQSKREHRIIGIGGASTSGKSTLAESIETFFAGRNPVTLHQDEFCFPEEQLPRINGRLDWERPEAVDFDKTIRTVEDARKQTGFIIHEGYMAFCSKELNELYTHCIFLEIDKETFLQRKKKDTRWGDEPDWYVEHIWESYLLYGQPPDKLDKLLVIKSINPIELRRIISFLD